MKKPLRTAGLVAGGAAGMILALAGCRAPCPGKEDADRDRKKIEELKSLGYIK